MNHTLCRKCGIIDGTTISVPSVPSIHGRCRCGGEVEEISCPPPLPGRQASGWVIAEDEYGERFPAVYDHAEAVWRRSSYPGSVDGLPAYQWKVAGKIIRWNSL